MLIDGLCALHIHLAVYEAPRAKRDWLTLFKNSTAELEVSFCFNEPE